MSTDTGLFESPMQRVLVIGSGGAGKSTFATRLAQQTALPLIHLDALYWRPGWIASSKQEWAAAIETIIATEQWLMDGNYGGTMACRLAACDTVIFLDLPWWICLWRVVRRSFHYRGRARPDMTAGCNERLSAQFLWWIFSYPILRRPAILRSLAALRPGQRAVILRSNRAMERFLGQLAPA